MPAKSNVRKSTSKSGGFKFRWWMGLVLIALIAVVGVIVVRFSNASIVNQYDQKITNNSRFAPSITEFLTGWKICPSGATAPKYIDTYSAGRFIYCGRFIDNGHIRWFRINSNNTTTCAEIQRIGVGPNKTRAYFVIDDENSSDLDTGKTVLIVERPCSE